MPDINSIGPESGSTNSITQQLFVNDGPLQPDQIALLRPSDPNLPIEELRARLAEDNYLFLKGLLPRADVLKAREAYFSFLSPSHVLKPGTKPVEGIFDSAQPTSAFPGIGSGETGGNNRPGGDQAQVFVDLALKAHTEDWYAKDFCEHPALMEFVARFSGWGDDTLLFKRSLLRNSIPGTHATGVHYDQIFLRYGDVTNLTAWCPMGDIKINGGGLMYLEKSE
jgi:phytanoyl-CoA hydroxylase